MKKRVFNVWELMRFIIAIIITIALCLIGIAFFISVFLPVWILLLLAWIMWLICKTSISQKLFSWCKKFVKESLIQIFGSLLMPGFFVAFYGLDLSEP